MSFIINPYVFSGNPLWDGLVNAYTFDNNLTDDVGGANGTVNGSMPYTSSGIVNDCVDYDGSTGYGSYPDNSWNQTTFTASFWFNTPNVGGLEGLVGTWNDSTVRGWLVARNGSGLLVGFGNDSTYVTFGVGVGAGIVVNTWYHVILERVAGTHSKVWVNNNLESSNFSAINPTFGGTKCMTGAYYSGTAFKNPFDGRIDALQIWNRALTSDEKTELYNSGSGLQYP